MFPVFECFKFGTEVHGPGRFIHEWTVARECHAAVARRRERTIPRPSVFLILDASIFLHTRCVTGQCVPQLSGLILKYGHVCGKGFLTQVRRERRAYPQGSGRSEQRSLRQKDLPPLACSFVARRSQSTAGKLPPRASPQAITLLVVSTRPATPFASWTAPAERGGDGAFARTRGPQASAVRRPHESGVALPAAVHDVPRNFDVPGNSVRVMDCAGKAPAATALSDARGSCELLSTVARTEARWRNKKFLRADAEGANRPYQGSTVAH
jgi:hypothetical protein